MSAATLGCAQAPVMRLGSYAVRSSTRLDAERTGLEDGTRVAGRPTPRGAVAMRGSLSVNICPAERGGPHVLLDGTASPIGRDSLGFTRRVRIISRGSGASNPARECLALKPSDLVGRASYRDQWSLTRPWGTRVSEADALIIQAPTRRGPRLAVRVLEGGRPVAPREPNGYVEMYPPSSSANLTIQMELDVATAVPLEAGIRPPCHDCGPATMDSAGVSVITLGEAMRRTGLREAPGKPGWTEVRTVVSRSALRERLLLHLQSQSPPCPIDAMFDSTATIVCSVPAIRFVDDGVMVELKVRPVTWLGGDTLWTTVRLRYPLRPIDGRVLIREPSRVEVEDPLQTAHTAALQRLVVANLMEVLVLSLELQQAHSRPFGNACLMPDLTRAMPPRLSEGPDDVLVLTIPAPVVAEDREDCPVSR